MLGPMLRGAGAGLLAGWAYPHACPAPPPCHCRPLRIAVDWDCTSPKNAHRVSKREACSAGGV